MLLNFHFHVPLKASIQNLVKNDPVVSEINFNFLYVYDLRPMAMTLTLINHLLSFTELVVCIYQFLGHRLQ